MLKSAGGARARLDRGRVVEMGTHLELQQRGGY